MQNPAPPTTAPKYKHYFQNKPNGPEDTGELYALYEAYGDILMNSDVRELLTAEHGMSILMNQVMNQIYNELDIDVSFLDS